MIKENKSSANTGFKKFIFYLRWFLNSKFYPILIAVSVLISHTFSIEEFGITMVLLTVFTGLIICDDLSFIISPLFLSFFMFSEKSVSSGRFYEKPYLIAMVIGAIVFGAFIIAHFIIHRKNITLKSFSSSKLSSGFVLLSIAFLLNGCLNLDEYEIGNITFSIALIFSLLGIFFLFTINVNKSKSLMNNLMFILFLVSVLITLEVLIAVILAERVPSAIDTYKFQIVNGELFKNSIKLGWGMWNNIGGFLAFLLPVHFYLASTKKKVGFIFYITALISMLATTITLSRSSLLSAGITFVICAILCCFTGVNKKINRIITIAIFVLGVIGIIVLWGKITTILGDYISRGLDDNGRFEMYKHGLLNYLLNPIFGGGFTSSYPTEYQFIFFLPYRYHNTIIQMLATCGSIGIFAYLYHRYQTIKLFFARKTLSTVYLALCIGTFLFASMFDNHFFNIYPAFTYSIMLMAIEKTTE